VGTFDEAVFPRLPWRNKGGPDLVLREPDSHDFSRKLATIIGAEENGGVSFLEDSRQERDNVLCKDGGGDQDPQTFAGKFIQNAQGFELPPVRQTVKQNVVSPDMVRILGLLRLTGRFVLFSPFSGALWRDLKVILLPEPPGTSKPHATDDCHTPIPIARIGFRGCAHLFQPFGVLIRAAQDVSAYGS